MDEFNQAEQISKKNWELKKGHFHYLTRRSLIVAQSPETKRNFPHVDSGIKWAFQTEEYCLSRDTTARSRRIIKYGKWSDHD